jgi:hypothetical protein
VGKFAAALSYVFLSQRFTTLKREEATTAEIRVHLMKLLAVRNAAESPNFG